MDPKILPDCFKTGLCSGYNELGKANQKNMAEIDRQGALYWEAIKEGDGLRREIERLEGEVGRLKAVVRVNGLRWGHTHDEIDSILNEQSTPMMAGDMGGGGDWTMPVEQSTPLERQHLVQKFIASVTDRKTKEP